MNIAGNYPPHHFLDHGLLKNEAELWTIIRNTFLNLWRHENAKTRGRGWGRRSYSVKTDDGLIEFDLPYADTFITDIETAEIIEKVVKISFEMDPQWAKVIELRFIGYKIQEAFELLGIKKTDKNLNRYFQFMRDLRRKLSRLDLC